MVNEWTRDDLPKQRPMIEMHADAYRDESNVRPPMALVLDAVVEHLNAHHPKPGPDRWRRAHAIVEAERDTARESLREACGLARSLNVEAHQATKRAESAERERDASEYAETEMERERDEWKARAGKWYGKWQKSALASTVTREDVAEALARCLNPEMWNVTFPAVVNEICDLFGVESEPADPVEDKAREIAQAIGWGWDALDDEYVEIMRSVAAHVLGQEDRHVDQ